MVDHFRACCSDGSDSLWDLLSLYPPSSLLTQARVETTCIPPLPALSLIESGHQDASANEPQDGMAKPTPSEAGGARGPIDARELSYYCGPHDLKRLDMYSRNLVSTGNIT